MGNRKDRIRIFRGFDAETTASEGIFHQENPDLEMSEFGLLFIRRKFNYFFASAIARSRYDA
jgi:hypothetical protein